MVPTIWQVAGGVGGRAYADMFLKHGVAPMGPGDIGPCDAVRLEDPAYNEYVKRFAVEVKVGDIILLRSGVNRVVAIGIVASEYQYLPQFDDVNGCDLEHARRVRWFRLPEPYEPSAFVFGANPPRLSRCQDERVKAHVARFIASEPSSWQVAPLPLLPPLEPALEDPPRELRVIVGEALDLFRLYTNRDSFTVLPSEDEIIAHLVVPFFRALGWPPELVAVQWCDTDVCLFERLPRRAESCRLLVEAKRLGAGIEGALAQARGYAANHRLNCDLVVTDGLRYRLYAADRDFEPAAYANLSYLKRAALDMFNRLRRR